MSSNDPPTIQFNDLTVRFPERNRPALIDVAERINPGEVVVITGPSGCGKSSLCRTLAGFIPSLIPAVVTGDVRVAQESVFATDPARLAARIGLVQQDPDAQVCTMRVRQEVAFGPENLRLPPTEVNRRVEAALESAGIADLAGRETTTLSGGEKQRLAIASILAMEPQVLLLDEPTANLDPAGAQAIFDTLARLRQEEERTLLITEHRLAPLLQLEPRLLVIDEGRIVVRRPARRHEDLVALGLRSGWPRQSAAAPEQKGERLILRNVSFSYGYDSLIEDLSLTIYPGKVLGLIGPNGGGKTTFLRLIAGLESPQAGTINRPRGLRVGMVFQQPHQQIFERSVRRELDIEGVLDADRRSALLDEARLAGLENAAPLSLSLGEQRRLTVVTAFRTRPGLILLDEPFIGQDRHNAAWIIGRILAARERGAIILLVSHDIPLVAALCDSLLYLGEETIAGSPDAVFARLAKLGRHAFTPGYWNGDHA